MPQVRDGKCGSWRAGRPPDLFAREKTGPCCQLLRIAALRALHCRAVPGNSSIAGAAPLDSVRLRRNCSLLLCVSQSSSLTCARGADRACAREKAEVLLQCRAVLSHALAALTALNKSAVQAVEICYAALDAYPGGSQGKKMVRSRGLEPRTQ